MKHASEEDLVDAYYCSADEGTRRHLEDCASCRAEFLQLKETLDAAKRYPVPERPVGYEARVWAQVQSRLQPGAKSARRWLMWSPALAAAMALAFFAGTWTEQRREGKQVTAGISGPARERVLRLAIVDHLERSQIALTEVAHANPQTIDLPAQRRLARELVSENRLLRERAASAGDAADAFLLEELQRVLLDVANGSGDSAGDLEAVRQRMEDESLLFKVRIMSADAYRKGQKL